MLIEDTTANHGFFSCFSDGCNGSKLATEIEESSWNVIDYSAVSHLMELSMTSCGEQCIFRWMQVDGVPSKRRVIT